MVGNQNRKTPLPLYDQLNKVFNFDCDPVADASNRLKVKIFYTTDSLNKSWGVCNFVNPPYKQTKQFILKAIEEAKNDKTSVMLIMASVGSSYWQEIVFEQYKAICFYKGRISFDGLDMPARFDSAIAVFSNQHLTKDQLMLLEKLGKTFY